jgi:hypothetical protein
MWRLQWLLMNWLTILRFFEVTLENICDTQMCRDTRFEKPHAHRGCGGGGVEEVRGDKSGPHSKMFTELLNKNAIKPEKGVPSLPKFLQPLCTLPPEIWQEPYGPSPQIFKPCAWSSQSIQVLQIHWCTQVKNPGGRVAQIFARIPRRGSRLSRKIARGSPYFGFHCILINKYFEIRLGGSYVYPLPSPFTPPVCIYVQMVNIILEFLPTM